MRILLASVTNRDVDVLTPHLASVKALRLPPDVTLDLAYISDDLSEDAERLLVDAGARIAAALPKPDDATYAVTEDTHEWAMPTFGWLAREKQRLLDLAADEDYDGIFFVDSDLVLGPDTLASLITASKEVVSAVFWTSWTRDSPPLPQVWMRHPYDFAGRGVRADEFLRSLDEKSLRKVGGLGACTLISADVFDRVRWFPLVEGLPSGGMWQGEDRHFCVYAARNHVDLWADAWPDIFHIYRPSDINALETWKPAGHVSSPRVGDWVSLLLEPVEEKELTSVSFPVRGRLGVLDTLPEVEDAVASMHVGEVRIVPVTFPSWWSLESYRGRTLHIIVRLVDAKTYTADADVDDR